MMPVSTDAQAAIHALAQALTACEQRLERAQEENRVLKDRLRKAVQNTRAQQAAFAQDKAQLCQAYQDKIELAKQALLRIRHWVVQDAADDQEGA